MADQQYYSLFTKQGLALLTDAIQHGTKLGITSMAFGDGGGSLPVPNESMTKLVNEVYRTQLNSLAPDPNNANWLRAEAIIASAVGGFNIRELGLYAGDTLVAYSNYPSTYKPNPSDGTARIMTFRMVLQIDNTASFELKIDPDVVLATIQSVSDAKQEIYESTLGSIDDHTKLVQSAGKTAYIKGTGVYTLNGNDWEKDIIKDKSLNLLDYIPFAIQTYLTEYSKAYTNTDIYPYLKKCLDDAADLNRSVYIPSGYFPVSQMVIQPNNVNVFGEYGKTFIMPSKDFPEFTWLWEFSESGVACNTLNGINFYGEASNSGNKYYGAIKVSAMTWFCSIKNVRILNCFYSGFYLAPRHKNGKLGVQDFVNFNIENIFFLDCGSANYHPVFNIDLNDNGDNLSGNWTDGSIRNIDIACADGDQQTTRGAIGLKINAQTTKTIFNVVFDRWFFGTRLQSHTEIDAASLNGNTFSNFSGETHNTIYNGQDIESINPTYQHNWINAGQWNNFININSNMSLGDPDSKQKGLYLGKSYANIIQNMPLNASYQNKTYELLHISKDAILSNFNDCNIRYLENSNYNSSWHIGDNLFGTTLIDEGINTKFNNSLISSTAVKEHTLSYYSEIDATKNTPTNSSTGTGYDGLLFSQNNKSLIVTLVASKSSIIHRNFLYPNDDINSPKYYVLIKVKQTKGSVTDNYLEFGMFNQAYRYNMLTINEEKVIILVYDRVPEGADAFVIAIGNSQFTTEDAIFEFSEIFISTQMLPYLPNCTIISKSN